MSDPAVLILDDDNRRVDRFRRVVADMKPRPEVHVWHTAHGMIRDLDKHLSDAAVLSLDHDLEPLDAASRAAQLRELRGTTREIGGKSSIPGGTSTSPRDDPGDGLDVARHLAGLSPACPVILHSSNADRTERMIGTLDLAGWRTVRVPPWGDDWIEVHWAHVVRTLLSGES